MKGTKCNPHYCRKSEQALLFCFSLKTVVRDEPFWMRDRPFWMYDESFWICGAPFWMRDRPCLFCIIVYQEAAKNAIFTGRSKRIVDTY